jgi:tetratricopeptide (TPR) repeat protein
VIGGGNNIGNNVGNNVGNWGLNNRPGGDWWSQNHNWNQWHDHCINDHHGWYNGCWNNNWGSGAYAPLAWGAVGWGLGSYYGSGSSYGYSEPYYNPYYDVAATAMPYDYSQPVTVANYVTSDSAAPVGAAPAGATQTATPAPPQNDAAMAQFDQGMADFKAGNYPQAIARFDAALKQLPGDPVIHEVRALAQFAVGAYKSAAAGLNSLLATAPGMDWTTMASLYGNVDDYTQQLRKLEQHCRANVKDASAYFVLAYQYLVTGHQEAAVDALKIVVREQPKDATAQRMLASLAPKEPAATSTAAASPPAPASVADAPQTDLVGTWRAKAGDSSIDLTITDNSEFTWKATQAGKPPIELKGDLTASSDMLILENKEQGSMVGRVTSGGPDKWQFAMNGAPPNDPGLSFVRNR